MAEAEITGRVYWLLMRLFTNEEKPALKIQAAGFLHNKRLSVISSPPGLTNKSPAA
jgi:hypothetical protein